MKKMILLAALATIFGFFNQSLADGEVAPCSTLEECKNLLEEVQNQIDKLTPVFPTSFLDVEKNADGTALMLTKAEAIKYCNQKGAHLPTAKEMTDWALAQGSSPTLSVLDVVDKYDGQAPDQYKLIVAVNADGSSDKFYYASTGYTSSKNALETGWFWTSSSLKDESTGGYLFFARDGIFLYAKNALNAKLSVRCASGVKL